MPDDETPEPETSKHALPPDLREDLESIAAASDPLEETPEYGQEPPSQPVEMRDHIQRMAEEEAKSGDRAGHARMANLAGSMRQEMLRRGLTVKGEDSDKGVVKGKGTSKVETLYLDPKVVALDLADDAQAKEYERVMKLLADPTSGYFPYGQEQGPEILENRRSPKGFSAIVVLRYSKVSRVIVDKSQDYDIIKPEDIRERFNRPETDKGAGEAPEADTSGIPGDEPAGEAVGGPAE